MMKLKPNHWELSMIELEINAGGIKPSTKSIRSYGADPRATVLNFLSPALTHSEYKSKLNPKRVPIWFIFSWFVLVRISDAGSSILIEEKVSNLVWPASERDPSLQISDPLLKIVAFRRQERNCRSTSFGGRRRQFYPEGCRHRSPGRTMIGLQNLGSGSQFVRCEVSQQKKKSQNLWQWRKW